MKILSFVLLCVLQLFSLAISASRARKAISALESLKENDSSPETVSDFTTPCCPPSSPNFPNGIDAIINRFQIYIRNDDISAMFCELGANSNAAHLTVFEGVFQFLLHIPQRETYLKFNDEYPVDLVASVFRAFIHFNVNVVQARQFKNDLGLLNLITRRFRSLNRPFLAFFILLRDKKALIEFSTLENQNFYAVHNAILLLPSAELQARIVEIFYQFYGPEVLTQNKITKRLFRDSPEIPLCRYLLLKGFLPGSYPNIYKNCKRPVPAGKWDFFSEIYGRNEVESFLQSRLLTKPQGNQLPFLAYPLNDPNHRRWEVYEAAFGTELIAKHKTAP